MPSKLRELFGDDDRISKAFADDDGALDRLDVERDTLADSLAKVSLLPGGRRRLIDVVVEILQGRTGGLPKKDLLNELNRDAGKYPCPGSNVAVDEDQLDVCLSAHPDRARREGGSIKAFED